MNRPRHGAFVISLDFELQWGVRDIYPPDGGRYRGNLLGVRQVVPALLDLFDEFEVVATWATVGMLFARTRADWERHRPALLPAYENRRLFPYDEPLGDGEADDPLHYAPGLIGEIQARRGHEIATHTYSHYYCLEPGQTRDAFEADLVAGITIAREAGVATRSIVFPRNQINPDYLDILARHGVTSFRGAGAARPFAGGRLLRHPAARRLGRRLDVYAPLSGRNTVAWNEVRRSDGLSNVRSSRFLQPCGPGRDHARALRLRRILGGLVAAAEQPAVYHLWWHPHNFGVNLDANIDFLRDILTRFAELRDGHGLRSMTMAEVAKVAPGSPA